uniref:Uncharacterized protein n=1 Tax=mine drainage metagenome TaxID=410659 RepID=E6PSQ0_9ZZZZ
MRAQAAGEHRPKVMLDKPNGEFGSSTSGLNEAHMTHCRAGSKPLALLGRAVGHASCGVKAWKPLKPAPLLGRTVGQGPARPIAISLRAE